MSDRLLITTDFHFLAETVCSHYRGEAKLLREILAVRKAARAAKIAAYRERGDHDVADYAETKPDIISDGLESIMARLKEEGLD